MKIHEGTKLHASVVRRRQILAICLLPMLATWCFLIVRITPMYPVVGSDLPNQSIFFGRANFASNSDQYFTLDPRSNRLQVVDDDLNMFFAGSNVSRLSFITANGALFSRWRLSVKNPQTGNIDRVKEFDLPVHINKPLVFAQRFVVNPKKDILAIIDLDSNDMASIEYTAKGVNYYSHIFSLEKTNNLVYISDIRHNPITLTPQVVFELYSINEAGVPAPINSWIGAQYGRQGFSLVDDQLVTIHPTSACFEFRSIFSGNLISSPPLPADLNISKDAFSFIAGRLSYGASTYSLERLRSIRTPTGTHFHSESPDKKLQLWDGNHEWVVTDNESELELARFDSEQTWWRIASFLDNENIIQCSFRSGFTIKKISARTGKTVMTWRPNWWAFPLLLFTVPAYVVWSFLWLKTVSESSRNAWWDIALIAGLPIVAFSIRFAFVEPKHDLNRYPSHLIFGIFLAVAFVASVWLWSSQQNIVLRCLPWLWSLIAIANVLVFVFAQRSSYSDESRVVFKEFFLLAVLVPVFAICFLFRLVGFRLNRDTHFSNSKMFTCSLKDLLIIVATCALLFSPLRSIELKVLMMEADQADFTLWPYILIAAFSPCLAWFLAMSKNRSFFLVGVCLSILALAWLLFDLLYAFVEGQNFQIDGNWIHSLYDHFSLNWTDSILVEWYSLLRISSTAFVSTFLLAHGFRYRGWRWDRASRRLRSSLRDISGSTKSQSEVVPIRMDSFHGEQSS